MVLGGSGMCVCCVVPCLPVGVMDIYGEDTFWVGLLYLSCRHMSTDGIYLSL